jgi:hypothetical protein
MDKKQQIIAALYAFARQRSGIEFCNYGDVAAFRAEQRSITKNLHHARQLIRDVELRDSITADDIIKASQHAYSGRLTIVTRDNGAVTIDYCTGQYFPTEYRRAVCAVMASVLLDWKRTQCMPEPVLADDKVHGGKIELYNGKSAGQYLRDSFKREYGRAIASRWFD